MEEETNKFNEAEIVVGSMGGLFVDGLCILLDLTGVGLGIAPFVQGSAMFGFSWWLKSKGSPNAFKLNRQIARQLSNLLPLAPTVTAVFLIDVFMHNHPEKFAAVAAVAEKISKKPV